MRVNAPLVVHDEFDGEVMAVRNDTGTYYSMDGSAAVVWAALTQGRDTRGAAEIVAQTYRIPVQDVVGDVEAFVSELVGEHLVVDDERNITSEWNAPSRDDAYEPPAVRAYTDMQDLLLFDPIHEVTPSGWPDVANAGDR